MVNSYYHRSYEHQSSIEINIHPDKIEILSFPGPLPPITNEMLKWGRIVSRDYRNRRIGDFLKELNLTEGRGTGFPKIHQEMKSNGSPAPYFETDADRVSFLAKLPIHPAFLQNEPENEPEKRLNEVLSFLATDPHISGAALAELLGVSRSTIKRDLVKLENERLIKRIGPDKGGYWEIAKQSEA